MKKSDFFNLFKPEQKFADRTKRDFLAAFRAKHPLTHPQAVPFSLPVYIFRSGVFAVALMFIFGTASTYAYETDVSPENALYPLKRIQEDIRVVLKPKTEKSAFHLQLAEKRLKEVEILKDRNVNGGKIEKLTESLHQEVKKSLITFQTQPKEEIANQIVGPEFVEPETDIFIESKIEETRPTAQEEQPAASSGLAPISGETPETVSIQVVSPNGGEKIPFGPRNFHVKYKLSRHFDEESFGIGFHLLKNGEYLGQLIPPGGRVYADPQYWNYSWTPGRYFPVDENWPLNKPIRMIRVLAKPGSDYTLRIILYHEGKEIARDASDNAFTIFDDGKFKMEQPKTDNKILMPIEITEPAGPTTKQIPSQDLTELKTPELPKITKEPKPEKSRLCETIQKLIENRLPEIKYRLLNDPEIVKHLEENCGELKISD